MAQPEDGAEAKRMVVEEQEEELLDEAGLGLTVPVGAPRPALIIVMVCAKQRTGFSFAKPSSLLGSCILVNIFLVT